MPKMKFNTRVKYKGTVYKGLEPFDVDEADVPEMQAHGGVIIVESEPKQKAQEPEKAPDKPDDSQKQRGKKKAAGDN